MPEQPTIPAAVDVRTQGGGGRSVSVCRPQRERRPPLKLADAAELCDISAESTGESLSLQRTSRYGAVMPAF